MPAGSPVVDVGPALPELINPDAVTTIDDRTPFCSGTDVDWFSAKMPFRPEFMVEPDAAVTLELPCPLMALSPLEVVLVTVPVMVAPAPTTTLICPCPPVPPGVPA